MSTVFSDNFNRADGDITAEANWDSANSTAWSIASNQLSAGSGGSLARLFTTTSAHAAIADCKVSITRRSGANFDGGVSVRDDGTGQTVMTGYFLDVYGTNNVEVYRRVAGTETLIGNANATHANGDKFTLEVSGTGATVTLKIYKNDVLQGTLTDTDASRITAAGRCGVITFHSGDLFDDFLVEDLASGGVVNTKTAEDTLVVGDSFVYNLLRQFFGVDSQVLADDVVSSISGSNIFTRIADSLSTVSDSFVTYLTRNRDGVSVLVITEGPMDASVEHVAIATDDEVMAVTDEVLMRFIRVKLSDDAVVMIDSAISTVVSAAIVSIVVSEAVSTLDAVAAVMERNRDGSSVVVSSDSTSQSFVRTSLLSDLADLVDDSVRQFVRVVDAVSQMSLVDSVAALFFGFTAADGSRIVVGSDQPIITLGGYRL